MGTEAENNSNALQYHPRFFTFKLDVPQYLVYTVLVLVCRYRQR